MKIEVGKFYKTRSGLKARIYAVDGQGSQPIHGAILYDYGWTQEHWYSGGNYFSCSGHNLDIVSEWTEPKPKLRAWIGEPSTMGYLNIVYFSDSEEPPSEMNGNWKRARWLDEP